MTALPISRGERSFGFTTKDTENHEEMNDSRYRISVFLPALVHLCPYALCASQVKNILWFFPFLASTFDLRRTLS